MTVKCCQHSSAYIFDPIFSILSCNKDSNEILDEFEICRDSTLHCRVTCPWVFGKWLLSVVNTLVPTFLIKSSSFFHVTRTATRQGWVRNSARFNHGLRSYLPLSIWKTAVKCCQHSSTYIFEQIFFILSCNKDSHEILDEFEIWRDSTMDCGVSCLWAC